MKMYIFVRETVPVGLAMAAVGHAVLACYMKFKDDPLGRAVGDDAPVQESGVHGQRHRVRAAQEPARAPHRHDRAGARRHRDGDRVRSAGGVAGDVPTARSLQGSVSVVQHRLHRRRRDG